MTQFCLYFLKFSKLGGAVHPLVTTPRLVWLCLKSYDSYCNLFSRLRLTSSQSCERVDSTIYCNANELLDRTVDALARLTGG